CTISIYARIRNCLALITFSFKPRCCRSPDPYFVAHIVLHVTKWRFWKPVPKPSRCPEKKSRRHQNFFSLKLLNEQVNFLLAIPRSSFHHHLLPSSTGLIVA